MVVPTAIHYLWLLEGFYDSLYLLSNFEERRKGMLFNQFFSRIVFNDQVCTKIVQHFISLGHRINLVFYPERLTCNFESATSNAFYSIFPLIPVNPCFFHYSQSLWRKMQDLGICRYLLRPLNNDNSTYIEWWTTQSCKLVLRGSRACSYSTFNGSRYMGASDGRFHAWSSISTYIDSLSCQFQISV